MKSRLFNIPKLGNHPIYAQYDLSEKLYSKLHFHNELQFTLILKGSGTLLCGSASTHYKKGDLFILGTMLPHVFIGDDTSLNESISVYCTKDWLVNLYPNSNYLEHLIHISKDGIKIENWKHKKVFEGVLNKAGIYRINNFLHLLETLSESSLKKEHIDSSKKLEIQKSSDSAKINEVFKYISEHLDQKIELNVLATLINLSPPSFCRYFKQKTNKTLSKYISELRIESACSLLQNENLTVEVVGYKVGYNNFSNFLRQFKKIKNQTPKEFRNKNLKSMGLN